MVLAQNEKFQQESANQTALAAIGPRKRQYDHSTNTVKAEPANKKSTQDLLKRQVAGF